MSIASAITAAQGRVADAYTAISNKGGTLPATQNLSNMPTAISSIPSGGTIDSLTITPTTSEQTITASGGVDGYSPITVNAVTSSIDANIAAGNIKSGVSILGVSGSVTELNGTTLSVTPTTSAQSLTPSSPYNGYTSVSVSAVTSSIDANITAGNIKSGVSILGVAGNVTQLVGETRSVSITSTFGNTFTPSSGKNAITSITVTPTNQAKTITPTTSQQTISVPSGYSGFGTLTVKAVTSSIDANIKAGNIKNGVSILGVTGTLQSGYSELPRYQVSGGVANCRSGSIPSSAFDGITSIGYQGLQNNFSSCQNLSGSLYFNNLITVDYQGLESTFSYTKITSANLSSLTTAGAAALQSCFQSCSNLTTANLSSLTTVEISGLYSCFQGCSNLTTIDLSSLTTVGTNGLQYCFKSCANLTTVNFSELSSIGTSGMRYCFEICVNLGNIYFNKLNTSSFGASVDQFRNMFDSTTAYTSGTCTVHFPSNMQSTISGLTGYPTFGGNSSRIVLSFDLPATS